MRLQRCSASAKSTLGKKQGGSNVPAGKSGRGEPRAAINQSRRGSFLAAKVAHFLAATDTQNHNETVVKDAAKANGLKVKTSIKAGALTQNHNETVVKDAGLTVKTSIKAGALTTNHNETVVQDAGLK